MTLKQGLLWWDADPKLELSKKVERAAAYYEKKYGQKPTVCYVHPSMSGNSTGTFPGIEIQTQRYVLPNHFWLGVGENDPSQGNL